MVTIQPWICITMCWSRQYDFNLVRHPTLKNEFFLFSKKVPGQDSNPGPRPKKSYQKNDALDRSAMIASVLLVL